MNNKIWKDIAGYEGLYKINEIGEVLRIDSGKILKHKFHSFGYPYVHLSKNGIVTVKKIHRLIAIAFIENPNNKNCVLHIDNNPLNYSIDNLIWGTQKENLQQCHREKRHLFDYAHPLKGKFGKDHNCSKKVYQYSKDGTFIKEWGSIAEIKRILGISGLSECCNGKRKNSGGFIWKFN